MSKTGIRSTALALVLIALALGAAFAHAEIAQKGQIRVSFKGALTPHALPRSDQAPVNVAVAAKISSISAKSAAPQLKRMSISINKYGILNTKGIPVCELNDIQPATTADALAVCRRSLVGEGTFSAEVPESGRSPFPAEGKLYAFNGTVGGKPAILAHVYGVRPAPTSFTLVFIISRGKGHFGTTFSVDLPKPSPEGGSITGISLDLGKTFKAHGKKQYYLTATCPTPKGVPVASFPFAKASFAFVGGKNITSTLNRSCKATH
jgi:hypothetical protein